MFGYPCAFVNGHMFAGLHQENLIVRLDERGRGALLAVPGAETFEPLPGRVMREYIVVPPRIVGNDVALREWIERAFAFAISLPIKGRTRRVKAAEPPAAAVEPARPQHPAAGKTDTKRAPSKKAPRKIPGRKTPARKVPAGKASAKRTVKGR